MYITLYYGHKKTNSTKLPTDFGSTMEPCIFKEPCSIETPVVKLEWSIDPSIMKLTDCNYAYLECFNRYYWITDIISLNNNYWEIRMKVDVLASFRTEIGNQECYVLRAESMFNGEIIDRLYPARAVPNIYYSDIQSAFQKDFGHGIYVLGIVNKMSSAGAVSYYVFTQGQIALLKEYLLDVPDYLRSIVGSQQAPEWNIDVSSDTVKVLFNPFQYIVSAMWFPLTLADLGITETDKYSAITLGWWTINISAYRIPSMNINIGLGAGTITANFGSWISEQSPYVDSKYIYMNFPPYSKYIMHFEPFGTIELNGSLCGEKLRNEKNYTIRFRGDIDLITGQCYLYTVEWNFTTQEYDNTYILELNAQIGVPVQLGQITSDTGQGAIQAIKAVQDTVGSVSYSGITAGIVSSLSGVYDALQTVAPNLTTIGHQSGLAAFNNKPYLISIGYLQVSRDPEERGYPVCAMARIGDLSGFIMTANCDIEIYKATLNEQKEIKAFMDGGFFYE